MASLDIVAVGRAGLDLYAEQIGVPFESVTSFAAYIGGTPANVAVGARRLGLSSAVVTAVSDDPVGDFIVHFLDQEGVETAFVVRKKEKKSGLVLLGILPPDHFPRVHYRDDCADQSLTINDVAGVPLESSKMILVVGTSLSHSPGREATLFAAERARSSGRRVVLDLDYRADLWTNSSAYSVSVRGLVRLSHIVIGTREEILAAAGAPAKSGNGVDVTVESAIRDALSLGPAAIVEKRGKDGSRVHLRGGQVIDAGAFRVDVQNTLGAGDAFAAGFLYGCLQGWEWHRSARLGNACGAIVAGRHACSASCPTMVEVMAFADKQGGL